MRVVVSVAIASALASTACDRPKASLICHNSNCAEPTDPENDDSLEALRPSLVLEIDGRPAIDGVEIDLFWRGSDSTCIFAHDLADPTRTDLASAAATELANHLAGAGPITSDGRPFQVFIELKAHVGPDKSERHTPAQRAQHAACAWDAYDTIANAAIANNREIVVFFASFEPKLLRSVIDATPTDPPFPPRYEAFYGIPRPLDSETRPLSDYAGLPISLVEFHAQWIHDAQYEGVRSSNLDIGFFMFSATVETFAAIEQYEPIVVNTNEAALVRRWLERE